MKNVLIITIYQNPKTGKTTVDMSPSPTDPSLSSEVQDIGLMLGRVLEQMSFNNTVDTAIKYGNDDPPSPLKFPGA